MPKALRIIAVLALLVPAAGVAWFRPWVPAEGTGLTLYGNIDIREVQPAFNASGAVTAVLVEEGAEVKRGQLLATLDDTRYAAALAQAQAQTDNQKQVLDRLLAGSRPEEIAQAKAAMDALETNFRNNEANWRRLATLAPTGAATIQQRDDARAAYESTRQQYEAARQVWLLAVKGPREEDIAAARAAWQASVAAMAQARRAFDDTRLYAPADGVIENRILEPGDMASPQTPVVTMALPSPLWVRAYVPETMLGRIRLGAPAEVRTDSFPGKVYHGWIGYLSPTAEFTPKTVETPELRTALVYQLRVYVCDGQGELRLGMPATVTIDTETPAGANPPPPGCLPASQTGAAPHG